MSWPKVVGMRNRLIHGYDFVDYAILWDTITEDFPPLTIELEKLSRPQSKSKDRSIIPPNINVTCHTAANPDESYVDCQTHHNSKDRVPMAESSFFCLDITVETLRAQISHPLTLESGATMH